MKSIDDGDTVYVAINPSDSDQSTSALPSVALDEILGGTMVTGPTVTVPARETMIFTTK
jgi:hypothetical protein